MNSRCYLLLRAVRVRYSFRRTRALIFIYLAVFINLRARLLIIILKIFAAFLSHNINNVGSLDSLILFFRLTFNSDHLQRIRLVIWRPINVFRACYYSAIFRFAQLLVFRFAIHLWKQRSDRVNCTQVDWVDSLFCWSNWKYFIKYRFFLHLVSIDWL
jgi:hypothetical protein